MRVLALTTLICMALSGAAIAQTADGQGVREEHPPTNRVGEAVPKMTTEEGETHEAKSPDGKEEVHPPTGRVGKAVPEMTEDAKGKEQTKKN